MNYSHQFIELVSEGAEDPVSVNYDYELYLKNNHPSQSLFVTYKVIFTTEETIETKLFKPMEKFWVCTVSGGPVFDNCHDVQIINVEPADENIIT